MLVDSPGGDGTVDDVMDVSAPIPSVMARISVLRDRFEARGAAHPLETAGAPVPPPPLEGFEPFGEVYQQAVEAARSQPQPAPGGVHGGWGGWGVHNIQSYGMHGTRWPGGFSGVGGVAGIGGVGAAAGGAGIPVNPYAVPTGASIGKIGGYGRLTPPPNLQAFGNGRIPPQALEPIGQGGHRLWGPAAHAWQGLVRAAEADGISIRITDSYRSFDEQVDLVRRKGLYSEGGYGAVPGTSNHGWGLAVDADITDSRTLEWMRANAWRFGYVEAVRREPWHWEFRPHQA